MEETEMNGFTGRQLLGFITGFLVVAVSLAYLFISAETGLLAKSVGAAFTAWTGYITIHYFETGHLIDPALDEKKLPTEERNWVFFGLGAVLFAGGMIIGAPGVSKGNFFQAGIGAELLILGYFIAHYELSDSMV